MRTSVKIAMLSLMLAIYACQSSTKPIPAVETAQEVEASCGICKFGMEGDDCALAVKIDGKPYYVDGTSIDEHGDAHGKTGFCNAIRKAEVMGRLENGRFKVTKFKLLP
ncbi:MAG: hypothetical protein RI924_466 [Bacteroidota bacterium]